MKVKRILAIVLSLLFLSTSLLAADPSYIKMRTSFSYSKSCFIGFSQIDIVNCILVQSDLKYGAGDVISCVYDVASKAYISTTFYAYCQAFTPDGLTVKVVAPAAMQHEPKENEIKLADIPYEIIKPEGGTNTSGTWQIEAGTNKKVYTVSDAGAGNEIRVLLSLPIKIKVPSANVRYGKTYSMNMTMEVIPL